MTLMNNRRKHKQEAKKMCPAWLPGSSFSISPLNGFSFFLGCLLLLGAGSCKVYSFKDISIPAEIKSIHLGFIENRSRYINPQLSPQLTDKLKQKISSQTRLAQVEADADYDVIAYISDYNLSTSGVSQQRSSQNRLTVTVHIIFKNKLNEEKKGTPDFESDVSRNFDFDASLTLADAESTLLPTIITNMTDEIFNRLFSNW